MRRYQGSFAQWLISVREVGCILTRDTISVRRLIQAFLAPSCALTRRALVLWLISLCHLIPGRGWRRGRRRQYSSRLISRPATNCSLSPRKGLFKIGTRLLRFWRELKKKKNCIVSLRPPLLSKDSPSLDWRPQRFGLAIRMSRSCTSFRAVSEDTFLSFSASNDKPISGPRGW